MVGLQEFSRQDATFAKLEKENDELRRKSLEKYDILKALDPINGDNTAVGAVESAKVSAAQEDFLRFSDMQKMNAIALDIKSSELLEKYNAAVEQEKGMRETNALNSGNANASGKSPLDYFMESPAVAALQIARSA